jgi:hypothetical protein
MRVKFAVEFEVDVEDTNTSEETENVIKNTVNRITDSVCDDSVRYTENFTWMSDSDSTKHEYENGIFYDE